MEARPQFDVDSVCAGHVGNLCGCPEQLQSPAAHVSGFRAKGSDFGAFHHIPTLKPTRITPHAKCELAGTNSDSVDRTAC